MIINLQTTGWEVIYHRAHALLAAQIAGHWHTNGSFCRLYEVIATISHHDDLEAGWKDAQITAAGAPQDFTLEHVPNIEALNQQVHGALFRGRWVALLTSMHLCFLSQPLREQDEAIAQFIDQQYQLQVKWRTELEINKDEAVFAYNFMRWCDRLSLILCQRQVPGAGRALEVTTGPDGKTYWMRQLESGDLTVNPWPFINPDVTFSIDTCQLEQLEFESDEALRAALKVAPRTLVHWHFVRSVDAADPPLSAG